MSFCIAQTVYAQLCIENLNQPQTGAPFTPLTVKIKNVFGQETSVAVANQWTEWAYTSGNCVGSIPMNGNAGYARNCFAYALYSAHGGPYHGNYSFVVAGFTTPSLNVVSNCSVQSMSYLTDYNVLLASFRNATAAEINLDGTVVIYTNSSGPQHAAVIHGNNTGMVRHVPSMLGVYEEVTLASVDSYWISQRGCTKTHYRLQQPFPANANAGVVTPCSNIKFCHKSININGPQTFCQDSPTSYTVMGAIGINATYLWSTPVNGPLYIYGGSSSSTGIISGNGSAFQNSTQALPTGSYSFQVKYSDVCNFEKTLTKTITLKGKVPPKAIVISSNYSCPFAYTPFTLSYNKPVGVTGYQWFLNGFASCGWTYSGSATSSTLSVTANSYNPCYTHLRVQNECGVSEPVGAVNIFIYNPNNPYQYCGLNPLRREIEAELASNASVFGPNPVVDKIRIYKEQVVNVSAVNTAGQVWELNPISIDEWAAHTLPTGLYMLQIKTTDGEFFNERMVKE